MIEEIQITNLGVIDHATLELAPGFTVVTGETGAGKTMVVTALGLLLGQRADSGAVRHGQKQAEVLTRYAVKKFSPEVRQLLSDHLAYLEQQPDGEEIIVGRTVASTGRSRANLGGRAVPAGILQELGEHLVAVHGQTDQLRLTSAQAQREALDAFAGEELTKVLNEYQQLYTAWQEASQRYEQLTSSQRQRTLEVEALGQAVEEINALAPQPGEDEQLRSQLRRLENLHTLRQAAGLTQQVLTGGEEADGVEQANVCQLLDTAAGQLALCTEDDEEIAGLAQRVNELSVLASDVAADCSSYISGLDVDQLEELPQWQQRLSELTNLIRKYGEHAHSSLDEVIAFGAEAQQRLSELNVSDDELEQLRTQIADYDAKLSKLAEELHRLRNKYAQLLSTAVSAELSELAMGAAQLTVQVRSGVARHSYGEDEVQFLLCPHPGAPARPLAKGASGGELSRVMLGLEVVLVQKNPVPTMIFDEVDAGVGGQAAGEIGRRLKQLAQHTQVIVVTHLAQVAAYADHHIRVLKSSAAEEAVTYSDVRVLNEQERVSEIARMLSGHQDSTTAQEHARELLAVGHSAAGRKKK